MDRAAVSSKRTSEAPVQICKSGGAMIHCSCGTFSRTKILATRRTLILLSLRRLFLRISLRDVLWFAAKQGCGIGHYIFKTNYVSWAAYILHSNNFQCTKWDWWLEIGERQVGLVSWYDRVHGIFLRKEYELFSIREVLHCKRMESHHYGYYS